jgi:glycosyltransferase involved in cell wall biosynthesis
MSGGNAVPTSNTTTDAGRPVLRLGVWMDYGETLGPCDGIGVFVHNLLHGLLDSNESLELVLQIHPGDEQVVQLFVEKAPTRVRISPAPDQTHGFRQLAYRGLIAWVVCSDRVKRVKASLSARATRRLDLAGRTIRDYMWSVVTRASRRWWCDVFTTFTVLPALCLLVWLAYSVWQVFATAGRIVVLPLERLDYLIRLLSETRRRISRKRAVALAKQTGCDVWVIPHAGFTQPLDFPAVLFIHDLVPFHFPEGFDPALVRTLRRVIPARAREATICACMSQFIRDHDLVGALGLEPEKVRMVRPAPPGDFPHIEDAQAALLRPRALRRPFLFYPSAFRPYKNHAGLIRALQILRDELGEGDFDLVFTGQRRGEMPILLERLADQINTRNQIHVLGHVDRGVLAALYKEAFATLMPSYYEQGSFPVYEALHWGCPVAGADIPSLREQCAAMGDAMLYFDPHDPSAIARVICALRDGRESVRQRQQQTRQLLWQRTWNQVAAEWLGVFREAAGKADQVRSTAA